MTNMDVPRLSIIIIRYEARDQDQLRRQPRQLLEKEVYDALRYAINKKPCYCTSRYIVLWSNVIWNLR
jgi:hypothetical protein